MEAMGDLVEDLATKACLMATSSEEEEDLVLKAASSSEEEDLVLKAASSSSEEDLVLKAASSSSEEDLVLAAASSSSEEDLGLAVASSEDESSEDDMDMIIWKEVQQITLAHERGEVIDLSRIMGVDFAAKAREWDIVVMDDGRRMERLKQSVIDQIRARPPRPPIPPVNHALYDSMALTDPKGAEEDRAAALYHFNLLTSLRDFDEDVLAQYEATGTAYIPVDDLVDDEDYRAGRLK